MTLKGPALKGLGHFEGKVHHLPISVYYEDTDLSGFVYHANYLRFMERARTEFFRLAGVTKMADLEAEEPAAGAGLDDVHELRALDGTARVVQADLVHRRGPPAHEELAAEHQHGDHHHHGDHDEGEGTGA